MYILFEDLQGDSLLNMINDRISNKRIFTEKEVATIMHQVLSVISYLHFNKIAHRFIEIIYMNDFILYVEILNLIILHLLKLEICSV